MGRLDQKVAIITGGSGTIGEDTVRLFAKEGAKVVIVDMKDGTSIEEDIRNGGGEATFIRGDLRNKPDIDNFVNRTIELYGRIDILFNHAGICIPKTIVEMTDEEWDLVIDINLSNVAYTIRKVLPYMIRQKGGSIITTSSIASIVGVPGGAHCSSYCASKSGQLGLTRSLAADFAQYNIRVNAIQPGFIDTGVYAGAPDKSYKDYFASITPLGRMGEGREIANVALFLASDESSFITGASLPVDGGFVLR